LLLGSTFCYLGIAVRFAEVGINSGGKQHTAITRNPSFEILDLIRSNEDLGNDYIENDFMYPSTEEIRNASPLAAVLPQDVMSHATLVATTVFAGTEDDRAV
jgi:hypothetical protein